MDGMSWGERMGPRGPLRADSLLVTAARRNASITHHSPLCLPSALFSSVDNNPDADSIYWPGVDDLRHGYVPGLRLLPEFANMTDEQFAVESKIGKRRRTVAGEGFQPSRWDGVSPVWRALDVRYDQCIGQCECLPGRDMREAFITIHFSCFQSGMRKPGFYESEKDFMETLYWRASG